MRKLKSFIDGFLEYTAVGASPMPFRLWGAIATVAGALEQKVWYITMQRPQYPHLYIILCGPPGVGKTFVTSTVWKLWNGLESHFLAATSLTSAGLRDELVLARRQIVRPDVGVTSFNSLLICCEEMQVFLPEYDQKLLGDLTTVFDNSPLSETRRHNPENNFKLERPQFNFLAATTPSYLQNIFPETAWEFGLMSRVILVYSGVQEKRRLFGGPKENGALWKDLQNDLKHISELWGEYMFEPDAADALEQWFLEGGPPAPTHPRLVNYLTRRHVMVSKLMVVSAVDRGDEPVLTMEDFERAKGWLLAAEGTSDDLFKSTRAAKGDGKVIEDLHHELRIAYMKHDKMPIPKSSIVKRLSKVLPQHAVEQSIKNMVNGGLLREETSAVHGTRYHPLSPSDEL